MATITLAPNVRDVEPLYIDSIDNFKRLIDEFPHYEFETRDQKMKVSLRIPRGEPFFIGWVKSFDVGQGT